MNNRILIVDDESDLTTLLEYGLKRSGFYVDLYNDPRIVVQNFKSAFYDLALIDVRMPYMDGFDLYNHVIKLDKIIKVCFLTAFEIPNGEMGKILSSSLSSSNSSKSSYEAPCVIQKPIGIKDLIKEVNRILS